jgi:hypothetical protein
MDDDSPFLWQGPRAVADSQIMIRRLFDNWVYGGFLAGLLILGLFAVIGRDWSLAFWLVALQLPVYMLHQFEEHDADRFRIFVNDVIGHGREALTPAAVFVINIYGVWGVNLVSIALAAFFDLGFGLIGIWLTLLNGIIHIAQGVALRRYNPGLVTAALLFLPLGIAGVWVLGLSGHGSWGWQMLGILVAAAIHVAIVVHVRRRLLSLEKTHA